MKIVAQESFEFAKNFASIISWNIIYIKFSAAFKITLYFLEFPQNLPKNIEILLERQHIL